MDRNKGNSLLEKLANYTVVDLETTGYDPRFDEIIELGALKVRDGQVAEIFQQLIKPKFPVDAFITELTGITNEMLEDAPSIGSVLLDYVTFIGDDVVVGHNVNFDINFIYDNLLKLSNKEFHNDYIDTMRISRKALKELEHHRLKDLIDYYGINSDRAHRSIADCVATTAVYNSLWNDIETKGIDINAKKHYKHYTVRASDILANAEPDENSPIYGRVVVFTGTLDRMIRKDAMQIVANIGGINGDTVTKKTNLLVLGNADYSSKLKDGKSSKYKKAEQLISKGADLQIISEDVFFDMIEQQ